MGVDVGSVAHDLLLLRGPGVVLPPLWSLKWEVVFSLLLPIAVLGAGRRLPSGLVLGAMLIGVTLLGSTVPAVEGYVLYLPMFGIGAVMARQHDLLGRIGRRLTPLTGAIVVTTGLVLLTLSWTAREITSVLFIDHLR